ncbi:hypothetical protein INR49_023959, partial [Caranx melampygus]
KSKTVQGDALKPKPKGSCTLSGAVRGVKDVKNGHHEVAGDFSLAEYMCTDVQVTVFSVTSKTAILRWTRYSGATSYKVSVAPRSSPSNTIAFATFGPNTVMGSINSLSANIDYVFTVEALDDSQQTLSTAAVGSST